jgi:hypothetical protein
MMIPCLLSCDLLFVVLLECVQLKS